MAIVHKKIEKVRSSLKFISSSMKRSDGFSSVYDDIDLNVDKAGLHVESRCFSTFNFLLNA